MKVLDGDEEAGVWYGRDNDGTYLVWTLYRNEFRTFDRRKAKRYYRSQRSLMNLRFDSERYEDYDEVKPYFEVMSDYHQRELDKLRQYDILW